MCAAALGAPRSDTEEPALASSTLKLGIAAQRIVVSVELVSAAASQSVSLMIDLAAPTVLALREDVMQSLKLAEGEKAISLVAAGGFRSSVPSAQLERYTGTLDLKRLSTLNSEVLDYRPLAGALGIGFLRDFDVVLDTRARILKLLPRGSGKTATGLVRSVRVDREGRLYVPVTYGAGANGELLLASDEYDSRVDASLKLSEAPVSLVSRSGESLDLSRHVALRPTHSMTEGSMRSGVGLLEHFRLTIDWGRKQIALEETSPAGDLTADKAYFAAETSTDWEEMADFIRRYPQSRFREEAARKLLDGRIADNKDTAAVVAAARIYLEAVPEKARPETALALATQMAVNYPERVSQVIGVGEAVLESAKKDPKALERYQIHRLLGTVRLASGDIDGAWKDFLAAVFGLPEDAQINLSLARIYERQGRIGRAYSRYQLTALLMEKNSGALSAAEQTEVKSALDRLRSKVSKHES